MPVPALVAWIFGAYVVGACVSLLAPARAIRAASAVGSIVGGTAGMVLGGMGLQHGALLDLHVPFLLPLGGVALRVDPLSGFFLVLIGVVGVAAAVYGFGYTSTHYGRTELRMLGAAQNLLLAAMSATVLAWNPITFLTGWEAVSLVAYLLVLVDPRQSIRAANWYLSVSHAGFAALAAMFFLLAGGNLGTPFDAITGSALAPGLRHVVFLLALVGCGAKAGIVPLHVWLPMAHPVAPSHGSALMSGAVVKVGVYGLVRVLFDLLGVGPAWWGGLILALGAVSALLGVLYALAEPDLKRLLAYSSVENIGIIFIGIGAALVFRSYGLVALAATGTAAALLHAFNHASFKALLFLGAGTVVQTTGTRSMEEMGGLVRAMPWTAGCFLIGAAAISALPPLNGFASEWLIFQTLFGGASIANPEVSVLFAVAVGVLALTGGLAAACFVKAFGITFLALPRSPRAEAAREGTMSMRVAMVALAALCVVLGIVPHVALRLLDPVVETLVPAGARVAQAGSIQVATGNQLSVPVLAALLVAILAAIGLGLRLTGSIRLRRADTWGCGRIGLTARMEYTAGAFAEPLRRVFAEVYRPTHDLTVEVHPESPYFIESIEYRTEIRPWLDTHVYRPMVRAMQAAAHQARQVQGGSLHLYLAYMLVTLLVLLAAARWL